MSEPFGKRLMHAWNAFRNRDPTDYWKDYDYNYGWGGFSSYRPDRSRLAFGNERSILTSVMNRIAIDCAAVTINHVKLDENGRYKEIVKSDLNERLTVNANKDQTGRAFIQDLVMSMLDEGVVAVCPIDCTVNPTTHNTFGIESMRVGKVVDWFPDYVRVNVYNDRTGLREDVMFPKTAVAIIENPLYAVMNEPNSTLARLKHKLNLLDVVDEQTSSGKLDIIIQLPYVIKSEARRQQAEQRRKDIEFQLAGSKYGIAYTDGTERITQLNRPAENNLMSQVQYLTSMLYSQLGVTEKVFDGTADEATMLNYTATTKEPILSAITQAIEWKFFTKTARTQGHAVRFFVDPFKLVPVSQLADIADKFTRNEILTSNEMRAEIGYKPVNDPRADELRNKNLNATNDQLPKMLPANSEEGENQNGSKTREV